MLKDVLPNVYLSHYSLLVVGVVLLLSENITVQEIEVARSVLKRFYVQFSDLYGM